MNRYAVELEQASKRFGNFQAVYPIDLAIPRGSIYGFIGPNGSGKTTTMRMILRIYPPDTGNVTVLGRSDGDGTDDRVSYLPEERGLYRRMTVRRVLRYFARLKGCRNPDPQINEWMERLGATDWFKKRIDQLSKGMAQKIQFVAAVVSQPELIILDEPFSGLDPVNMEVLRDAVLELKKKGTTVLFSTHDMSMAESMCDSICMIFRGQKVLDGSLDVIAANYGEPTLRIVHSADLTSLRFPGVTEINKTQNRYSLKLQPQCDKQLLLRQLIEMGELEHFELVRPSLHDIFVSIAKPSEPSSDNASDTRAI